MAGLGIQQKLLVVVVVVVEGGGAETNGERGKEESSAFRINADRRINLCIANVFVFAQMRMRNFCGLIIKRRENL